MVPMNRTRLLAASRLARAIARHWVAPDGGRGRVLPYKVNLLVTYGCNSRCFNCRIWNLYRQDAALKGEELSTEDWFRVIDGIADHAVWLTVSGGEPTQREDLAEIVGRALGTYRRLALVNVSVNGIDPARAGAQFESIARQARGVPLYVAVGLDGLGEGQDEVRGVPGAYAAARETFARLRALEVGHPDFHVLYHVTIGPRNYAHAVEIFDFASEMGLPAVALTQEVPFYRNQGLGVDLRSQEPDAERLATALRKASPWWPPEALASRFFLWLAASFLRGGRSPIPCAAGRATVTVDPFGNVLACPYLDAPLGNVRDHGHRVGDVLATPGARAAVGGLGACRRCWHNCEAVPSMFQHPLATIVAASRESLRRTTSGER